MGAPLLSPSSSLLSKRQREAVAESSRAEAAKKARCDGTVGTIQVAGGRDDVSPIRIPGVALSGSGVAPSGSGAVSPASPAASGAVQETPKDVPLPSDVGSPSGVPTASLPASRGAVEKVISIPSDEEEEAGDDEGLTGLADPAREIAGKEGPSSWANRSSRETGESEEDDDDASIHEALSSEEEDLTHEDATGQIGGSPAPAAVSAEDRSSVRESPLQREVSAQQVITSLSGVAVDAVIAVPRSSLVTPALATPITTSTVTATSASTAVPSMMEEAALSPLERERRKSAARSVAEFHDTMAACIRLALEESCPFESFEEDIDYIIGFLIKRLKHSGAQPYFQRKEAVKEAIQQLLALRAKSSTLVDLASGEVRAVVQERDRRLNETMSLEARLSEELEQARAENERREEVPAAEEHAADPILISDDESEGRANSAAPDPAPQPGAEPCLEIPPITALAPGQSFVPSESQPWQARIEEFEGAVRQAISLVELGAVEKVISIPSDEEEEAGDDEGLTGLADPAREIAGKEGPSSWANRSSRETGESEEDDDDASIHEALSSEEEDLAHEDATGQIGGSPAPAAVSAEDRSSVRESPLQREVSAQQVITSLSGVAVDAVIAVPRSSLVTPALATPITTSTVTATSASTAVPSMMEEAALSPLERERRKSAARSVAEFHDTMAACIRLALEESCPFESFEEDIDYIIGFLIKRLKHSGAQPYFQRKEAVKEAIQQLLALRAKSSTLVDLASGEVRAVVQERDRRLNETMSLEARLSEELEQARAENERMVFERQKADNRVSRLSSEVETLKQVIAKARASLAIQEKAREQAVKELENIESRQQLTANSVEEKERAHKEAKETVQDLASRTDEDLRREILRRLELRHAEELREAELRLKSL
ncbi:flagellar attachment zone protein 1-like [Asparagus officinalis]|uniref:flagellar attachment zone protein 1-like n=1 Tax=Asparagus officinalis TaxID=4686 RepID=UPI00098DFD9A|nr:flagellar attachment zone protein 1-like [Asparagus officinalis]